MPIWELPTSSYSQSSAAVSSVADLEAVDHTAAALNRLVTQFRKPKIQAFIRALCKPMERIEQGLLDVIAARNVDTAPEGVPLDIIGRLVRQPHVDVASTSYRSLVRARIPANKSSGLGDQVLRIIRLVLRDYALQPDVAAAGTLRLRLMNYGHASYVLIVEGVDLPWELAELVAETFLQKISGTAINAQLYFVVQQAPELNRHVHQRRWGDASTSTSYGDGWGDSVAGLVGGAMASVVQ